MLRHQHIRSQRQVLKEVVTANKERALLHFDSDDQPVDTESTVIRGSVVDQVINRQTWEQVNIVCC